MKYEDWQEKLVDELAHWEWAIRDKIENMDFRLNFTSEIQDTIKPYINEKSKILDVGAGIVTSLGSNFNGNKLDISAVDVLADEYNKLLDINNIIPPIRTIYGCYENIVDKFGSNTFNLVHTRNSLDHCNNPNHAILNLIEVCKNDGFVYIEVFENEANRCNWQGLHQWNFYINNDVLIISGSEVEYSISGKGLYLKKEIGHDGLTILTILINKKESNLKFTCNPKENYK